MVGSIKVGLEEIIAREEVIHYFIEVIATIFPNVIMIIRKKYSNFATKPLTVVGCWLSVKFLFPPERPPLERHY